MCAMANLEYMHAKSLQSCLILCNPLDCIPPGSSVHGILQARLLEWVVMPSSRGSSQPGDQTQVSHMAGGFFTNWATREAIPRYVWHGLVCIVFMVYHKTSLASDFSNLFCSYSFNGCHFIAVLTYLIFSMNILINIGIYLQKISMV